MMKQKTLLVISKDISVLQEHIIELISNSNRIDNVITNSPQWGDSPHFGWLIIYTPNK